MSSPERQPLLETIRLPDRRLRLAFFGTPEIAKTVLTGLIEANEDDVALVVCQPDRPRGRGKKVEAPPTKQAAEAHGIAVVQPTKMRDGVLTQQLRDEGIELSIVCAFGRILPQDMLDAPSFGAWNVHASLLPRHRGASPISFAILEGDEQTGLTLMQMTAGLDEGPMLLERALPIADDDTTETLTAKLAELGRDVLVEGLRLAKSEGLPARPQDDEHATFAPLLSKQDGELDFAQPAESLARKIRAFHPWPGTYVRGADGQPLKILAARGKPGPEGPAGTIAELGDTLDIHTGAGLLAIELLQPPGKKAQRAADFIRGAGRHLSRGQALVHR